MPRSLLWPDPCVKPPFGAAEIDWGHPLASKIVGCWPFNDVGGGTAIDLALGANGALVNSPSLRAANAGLVLDFASASDQYVNVGNPAQLQITDAITVATGYFLTTIPANVASFQLVAKDKNTGGRAYTLDVNRNTGAVPASGLRFYISGGLGLDIITEGRNPIATDLRTAVGSYRTSDKLLSLYINGAKRAEQTAATSGIATATANVLFARREYAGFTEPLNGQLFYVMIWNRKLSDSEVRWHAAEPYAMLRPIVRRRYFVPAAVTIAAEGAHGAMYPRMQRHIHQSWTVPR